ncbi:hypothetical protein ACFLUJ_07670 [Chloroflexota bacterium]
MLGLRGSLFHPEERITGLPDVEAHHIVELAVKLVDNPLRIVCICPICYEVIHYGNGSTLQSRYKKS